jgi:hypothetical protein
MVASGLTRPDEGSRVRSQTMAEDRVFHYLPRCSAPSCDQPATFKIGALWSDGTSRELKNYGLSCEAHRQAQLERARRNRDGLRLADGETVGPIALFRLESGRRDSELSQV